MKEASIAAGVARVKIAARSRDRAAHSVSPQSRTRSVQLLGSLISEALLAPAGSVAADTGGTSGENAAGLITVGDGKNHRFKSAEEILWRQSQGGQLRKWGKDDDMGTPSLQITGP